MRLSGALLALLSVLPGALEAPGDSPSTTAETALQAYTTRRDAEIESYATRYGISVTLSEKIHDAASRETLDAGLLYRLVQAESSFRIDVVSDKGAVGLAQVRPPTARWLDPSVTRVELFEPETNLRIAAAYLRYLLDNYGGDVMTALTAYNWGPMQVARGTYSHTYARRILSG